MLDWEHCRQAYEVDGELRYSIVKLRSSNATTDALEGTSKTNSAGVSARWRAPPGTTLMQRPLRYILEISNTSRSGPQRRALGFNHLTSLGAGIELDSSACPVVVTRTRLLARHSLRDNVSGFPLGMAVSF